MKDELLASFIKYFDNDKYKFESFCKIFLTWLGFDDVVVTPKSGDKGIDLRCTKREIDKIDTKDIEYIVQAKCYKVGNNVSGPDIRNFKGTRESLGKRRIFISTSDFTKEAREEAADPNQPVTLINGNMIMDYCKSLGDQVFDVHYICNKNKLDDLFAVIEDEKTNIAGNLEETIKKITKNDVRARILRIPSEYKEILDGKKKYALSINGENPSDFNISADGRYFGGVTNYYKSFIQDKDFVEAQSLWKFDKDKEIIYVEIKM